MVHLLGPPVVQVVVPWNRGAEQSVKMPRRGDDHTLWFVVEADAERGMQEHAL
jgi:hypothetical protein